MNLIVVESPTKARTLSRFLGKDYVIEATMGHIKDLPKSKLGVDVEKNFKPDYLVVKSKDKSIKEIKERALKSKIIYLATDPDREGEAIAKHVEEVLHLNGQFSISKDRFRRIVFHEITKEAVEEAIKNPMKVNNDLVNAQIARRVLDRLVGYKLSPLLWKKVRRGLSAGRVQTVTVRLIVEREREIEAFKPQEYWEIFVELARQSKRVKEQESKSDLTLNTEELSVLRSLVHFQEVIENAAKSYSPNLLCNYLFDLAQKFNNFYARHRILNINSERTKSEALSDNRYRILNPKSGRAGPARNASASVAGGEQESISRFRIELTTAVGQVLKNGLGILGLETPEKM